jgi:hypothetical protein
MADTTTPTTTAATTPTTYSPPAASNASSSGDLFQGAMLPAAITTAQTQQTAPEFYTNYLQDIANLGQNAVTQGGVAGFGPLQQQAMQMAPETAFAGAGTLGAASQLLGQSGATTTPSIVGSYMNPYTQNVVDEMARLQQQNIQRNVMPNLGATGVGLGSFGSKRQAQAAGQTLADMQANLTGQQYNALNTGYQNAMTNAQADLNRAIQAGSGLTNTGIQQNQLAQSGLNQLNTLGTEQQKLGQTMLDYPMTQAQNYAKLLQGLQMPIGTTTQTVAPGQQGQFQNSPLSQIAGLSSLIAALYRTPQQQAQSNLNTAQTNLATNQANAYSSQQQQTLANMAYTLASKLGYTPNADGTFSDSAGKIYNFDATQGSTGSMVAQ